MTRFVLATTSTFVGSNDASAASRREVTKRNICGAVAMLAVALMISVPMSQAQSAIRATVPFPFSLEQSSMPAGG
jgi:hypothetical protein